MNFGRRGGGHSYGMGGQRKAESNEDATKNALEVMQIVIQNSQKELKRKTEQGLPQDPEDLKKIFTKQQMLLELQTEMMSQIVMDMSSSSNKATPLMNFGRGRGRINQQPEVNRYEQQFQSGQDEEMYMNQGRRDSKQYPCKQLGSMEQYRDTAGLGQKAPQMGEPQDRLGGNSLGSRRGGHRTSNFSPWENQESSDDFDSKGFRGDFSRRRGRGNLSRGRGSFERGGRQDFNGRAGRGDFNRGRDDFGNRGGGFNNGGAMGDHRKRGFMYISNNDYMGNPKRRRNEPHPLNRPYSSLPVEDRFTMIKREVFKYDNFQQGLTVLESARHNCYAAHIRSTYEDEPTDGERYVGFLMMNGVLMGVEEGRNKVEAKVFSFAEALHLLITKPMAFIFSNSFQLYDKRKHPSKNKRVQQAFEDRLYWIHEELHSIVHSLTKQSRNQDFEKRVYDLDLGITQIYKKTENNRYRCDLYIDKLYISSGESSSKTEAYHESIKDGRRNLFVSPDNNWSIVSKPNRLTEVDFYSEDIVDILYRESRHKVYCNLEELKKKGVSSRTLRNKKEQIVIILPLAKSHLECLEMTALENDVLLEFVENSLGNCRRCIIYLNGRLIADSYSSKEISAKNMATERAKHVMMKKFNDVVQVSPVDFDKVTLTFDEIVGKSRELKETESGILDTTQNPNYEIESGDVPPNEDSPWVDAFLESVVRQYNETDGLDDMIFSHVPSYHTKDLINRSLQLNIKVERQRHKNIWYTIVQKGVARNLASPKFLECLSGFEDKTSGRYKLCRSVDIVPPIKKFQKEESIINFGAV